MTVPSSTADASGVRKYQGPPLPTVAVQGLGFVGSAMAAATANARDKDGEPVFNVIGVDLPDGEAARRVRNINEGVCPFPTIDTQLMGAIKRGAETGNLSASWDSSVFQQADVVLVSVNLDIKYAEDGPYIVMDGFRKAIETLAANVKPGSLIIVETTVPPGTCEHVVLPTLQENLKRRGLPEHSVLLAHSYERVMPGAEYLDSIVNFWRVYSGVTDQAADACRDFLSAIINTKEFPLTRLDSTTASETAKVLENSYRATTIAFMEEWGRYAEAVGIDIFQVINAIRVRPTHSNIRQPGFGVGGYCLTKDPLFAKLAMKEIFKIDGHEFPFCTQAVELNRKMPLVTLQKTEAGLGGLPGKQVLLLGVSYRHDVGDTRYSPSETFKAEAERRGATVVCHDSLLDYWPENEMSLDSDLPSPSGFDAVVFAVPHKEYTELDLPLWLGGSTPLIVDGNNVLTPTQIYQLGTVNVKLVSIGRG